MDMRRALLRRTWTTPTVVLGLCSFLAASVVLAASQDASCLEKAARDRASGLKTASDKYSDEFKRLADKLADDEADTLKITDLGYRDQEFSRTMNNYAYGLSQAQNDRDVKVNTAWSTYQQQRVACGFNPLSNIPNFALNQPINPVPYVPGVQPAPMGWPFGPGYYAPPICPQPILPPAPDNCSYSCQRDWNGCKICNLQCSSYPLPLPGHCACPLLYAPVCGMDGRTYDNDCRAQCEAGVGVQFWGACR